jgi:hypothetical protein
MHFDAFDSSSTPCNHAMQISWSLNVSAAKRTAKQEREKREERREASSREELQLGGA